MRALTSHLTCALSAWTAARAAPHVAPNVQQAAVRRCQTQIAGTAANFSGCRPCLPLHPCGRNGVSRLNTPSTGPFPDEPATRPTSVCLCLSHADLSHSVARRPHMSSPACRRLRRAVSAAVHPTRRRGAAFCRPRSAHQLGDFQRPAFRTRIQKKLTEAKPAKATTSPSPLAQTFEVMQPCWEGKK